MNTEEVSDKPSKTLVTGIVLIAICLIGTYAALFIPAFVGTSPKPMSGYASIFWSALFFYMLWKCLNKKKYIGVVIGIIVGILAFSGSAFIAGYKSASKRNTQSIQISEWSQSELTESYMRSISKNMCMLKTIESLKKCESEDCIRTMAGVTGDCVTFAQGSIDDFCSTYNSNFIIKYCESGVLSENACMFIRNAKLVLCK
jgi:hypothetical protein